MNYSSIKRNFIMQKPQNSRSGDTYKFHFFKKTLYLTHMVTNSSSYKSDSQQQRDHCFCVYGLTLPRAQKKKTNRMAVQAGQGVWMRAIKDNLNNTLMTAGDEQHTSNRNKQNRHPHSLTDNRTAYTHLNEKNRDTVKSAWRYNSFYIKWICTYIFCGSRNHVQSIIGWFDVHTLEWVTNILTHYSNI